MILLKTPNLQYIRIIEQIQNRISNKRIHIEERYALNCLIQEEINLFLLHSEGAKLLKEYIYPALRERGLEIIELGILVYFSRKELT